METSQLQRDMGRLEGKVEAQGGQIDELKDKLDSFHRSNSDKLDAIIAFQERQKGGAKVLFLFTSAAASIFGALAAVVLEWVTGISHHHD